MLHVLVNKYKYRYFKLKEQIESNFTGVRDNQTSRVNFAKAFLQSIMEFYSRNTSMQPSTFGK